MDLELVGALGERSRRELFLYVRRARRPVTRDEAAENAGISRKLAAFHLDKLVAAGLLRAEYAAPEGVRKVGRQPKVYLPADTQIHVSIPERRHEFLAGLFLEAIIGQRSGEAGTEAAIRTSRERGRELGAADRAAARPGRLGAERALTFCRDILERLGFEPDRVSPTRVRLRNCPFHPLAAQAPDLVCAMNQQFMTGYLDGLEVTGVRARLDPRAGECCVLLESAASPRGV
ncbi:helix-turn-helix transcriptional regulator [Nonomuraea sp. NPDC050536]|uniref:helix-turn-helix transcriptional regulator n=1 Tax=Nonomuraea sp. NPDC050536 TaxID=3364366 RepID=UPI0037C95B4F